MAALGNGLLHVDHDKLHVLLAPAALHGLQLLPLLGHFIVHATEGNGGERENHEQLHQKAELTRLASVFVMVPNLHWIIVEDSPSKTTLVSRFLQSSGIDYTHLHVETPR